MPKSMMFAALATALIGGISACAPANSADSAPPETKTVYVAEENPAEPVDDASAEPAPDKVKVPSVKATNLQVAVHKLEKKGFTNIVPVPVDGHAFAANYANWIIVGQDPAPGKSVKSDTEITLEVKKSEEAENSVCLDGDC